jgi:type VI secretion system protein ImpK
MMHDGSIDMLAQESFPSHFLLKFFQDFYCEVLREKERILSQKIYSSLENFSMEQSFNKSPSLEEETLNILKKLQNLLDEQAIAANHEGGAFGVACYREAQYIMAVLADEIFLSLPWEGRRYWEKSLLEQRLFGTHRAGDLFFRNLESFLNNRDLLKKEIGILYLNALGLGFRGKFRGFDDEGVIESYREKLFMFTYHQKPTFFQGHSLLFPATITATIEGAVEQEAGDSRTWFLIFCAAFGLYLFLSYGVWYGVTHSLSRTTSAILEDARTFS